MRRQHAVYKLCFKEASEKVLSHIQHDDQDSIQAKGLAFPSMSGVLWFNNVALAKRLLQSSELARMHVCLSGGKVSIANPGFSTLF